MQDRKLSRLEVAGLCVAVVVVGAVVLAPHTVAAGVGGSLLAVGTKLVAFGLTMGQ